MKTNVMIAAAMAAGLAACAGSMTASDPTVNAGQTSFTGWVKVSEGEFQLYPQERQLREAFSRPCVSGALPRSPQLTAADLSGSQVTFTGQTAPWSGNVNQVIQHEGSRITNVCRGDLVILAESVRVLR